MQRRIEIVLYVFLPWLFERVTPKGQHTKLRWYHRKPLYIFGTETTVLPNTVVVPALDYFDHDHDYVVQHVDPMAKAKRSTRRTYNWLIDDLANGQAMLAVTSHDDDSNSFVVPLPKGLKKGSGRRHYGCNFVSPFDIDGNGCGRAPKQAVLWPAFGDAYFVNCDHHAVKVAH